MDTDEQGWTRMLEDGKSISKFSLFQGYVGHGFRKEHGLEAAI